ncbi:hypothetical protein [Piscinibacter terrae]|uniref:Uncharacterized protein n=1 Tax=Piscinibacter terrae TaxID=2496871 RepID=A0A3N7JQZ3_9BURK|nr:hypothetical protein [Albitalea terrae]RQP21465.1 hypothetical protein DZC73_26450 [Albitalea terrae]
MLLINGESVGELRYDAPEQPWFVGSFLPLPGYAKYEALLIASSMAPSERQWIDARARLELLKLQVRLPDGNVKTLNRTLFQLRGGSRFAHRMCAEDFLSVYKQEIKEYLWVERRPLKLLIPCYRFARLHASLMLEAIQRRLNGNQAW